MAPQFSLTVHSFTPPTLPARPADTPDSALRSPHILPPAAVATSPLTFTISLPSARDNDPLYPATKLQLSFSHQGTGEVFPPRVVTSQDLIKADEPEGEGEQHLYTVQVPPNEVPRAKVSHEQTTDADVSVYAWKGEKLLGKFLVGRIEGLGFEGLKSNPLAISRQKARATGPKAEEAT